ncbi:MAG: hypothetical protein K1X57_18710 [Gemmataceae bacterium]|nr:hypothetical protein [Gemmataceae bacterium]
MRHVPVVVLTALALGCGRPAVVPTSTTNTPAATVADFGGVRDDLRKPFAGAEQLRTALEQLNVGAMPSPIDAATTTVLREKLRLTDADLAIVNQSDFGGLDGYVLEQSLFFRDAARTLDVLAAPAVERASAALEWAVRHVSLEDRPGPSDPPVFVAQRGRGTPLERLIVAGALCHALGLEVFAIGDPEAAGDSSKLWGLGILDGADVRLFDPRLGIPLPGKSGVGTLAGLIQDPSPLEPLVKLGYDVDAARLKAARLYPIAPITSLAPRWSRAESLVPPGTRVGVDARLLAEQIGRLPIGGFEPQATGTPPRLLSEFLPESEGGRNKPVAGQPRRLDVYSANLLPWDSLPISLLQLPGPVGNQIRMVFGSIAGTDRQPGIAERVRRQQSLAESARNMMSQEKESPTDPRLQQDIMRMLQSSRGSENDELGPTLRQLILRGQYSQATETMTALRTQLRTMRSRSEMANQGPAVEAWATELRELTRQAAAAQRATPGKAPADLEAKAAELNKFLPRVVAYVQYVASGPTLMRLDYLTALAKNDQAEAKARRDKSPAAWATAVQAWQAFLANYPDSPETFTARRLLADALEGTQQKPAAVAAYRQAAAVAKNKFDKIACEYLAGR